MNQQGKTLSEIYPLIINDILMHGRETAPRGLKIKEVCGYSFKLESIEDSLPLQQSRKLNYKFGILEGLMNVHGKYPADIVLHFNKNLERYMNKVTGTWDGAYAPRINSSIDHVFKLLRRDPDSRQAVIPIFRTLDIEGCEKSLDVPCTISLQFLYRDGRLNMIANMRSNDVLWGLAYDVNQFATIQRAMASWLGCPTGWYIHNAGSMHAYMDKEEQLNEIVLNSSLGADHYADFKHPVWNVSREETKEQLDKLFIKLSRFIENGEEDPFISPLNGLFGEYYSYLIGDRKVNFL